MTDTPVSVDDPTSPPLHAGVGGGVLEGDWPVRAADTVERVVDTVRSKTTGPAIVASRAVVYGAVGAVLAIIAVTLMYRGPHPGARRLPAPGRLAALRDPGCRAGAGRCVAVAEAAAAHLVSSGDAMTEDRPGEIGPTIECTRSSSSVPGPPV